MDTTHTPFPPEFHPKWTTQFHPKWITKTLTLCGDGFIAQASNVLVSSQTDNSLSKTLALSGDGFIALAPNVLY